jgi:hypothetical protein
MNKNMNKNKNFDGKKWVKNYWEKRLQERKRKREEKGGKDSINCGSLRENNKNRLYVRIWDSE